MSAKSFRLASFPASKLASKLASMPDEILVIQIGENRFLTSRIANPVHAQNPEGCLTYHPEEAHHWTSEEAAKGCAGDMALSFFRGHVVQLVRLKRIKGEYRVH